MIYFHKLKERAKRVPLGEREPFQATPVPLAVYCNAFRIGRRKQAEHHRARDVARFLIMKDAGQQKRRKVVAVRFRRHKVKHSRAVAQPF